MYVADPRFARRPTRTRPRGSLAYVRDAIHANADRHEGTEGDAPGPLTRALRSGVLTPLAQGIPNRPCPPICGLVETARLP